MGKEYYPAQTNSVVLWHKNTPGWDQGIHQSQPSITPYLADSTQPNSAVIICPGGGYKFKHTNEKEPIAKWLNSFGISAFVLEYRTHPYFHPWPLIDAQRALRMVRFRARAWNINPEKVGLMGFSAGGHLAASAAVYCQYKLAQPVDEIDKLNARPDALLLAYPVVSFLRYPQQSAIEALIGNGASQELIESLSLDLKVHRDMPPVFIWHTADDNQVPSGHSLLFAHALARHGIPYELHIFPRGGHGLALAGDRPHAGQWVPLCERWLKLVGF